jgi:MFS family permease
MTLASTSSSLLFNLSTNSNYELLANKLNAISQDPAQIGMLLGLVYATASLTQLWVGHMIDKYPLKQLYLRILVCQALVLIVATQVDGWWFYGVQFLFMAGVFGAIPFTDAMIVRFVDDTMRSRVTGMRLAVSFGASSLAVLLIGPIVKQSGFTTLLAIMAFSSVVTLGVISQLPQAQAQA